MGSKPVLLILREALRKEKTEDKQINCDEEKHWRMMHGTDLENSLALEGRQTSLLKKADWD